MPGARGGRTVAVMARRLTVAAAIVLALGLSGCDRRYCERTPPDDLSAILQAVFCWDATFPDSARPEPVIALDKTLIDSGETVKLDGSGSSDAQGRIDLYQWDIDGRIGFDFSTGDAVVHRPITYDPTYPVSPENAHIRLQVTDDEGLTADTYASIAIIEPLPEEGRARRSPRARTRSRPASASSSTRRPRPAPRRTSGTPTATGPSRSRRPGRGRSVASTTGRRGSFP